MKNEQTIIYDGVCNLCAGTVAFIRKRDRNGKFQFIPFQNKKVREDLLTDFDSVAADLNTVVLIKHGQVFTKSEAILEILAELGGVWKHARIFKIIPQGMRDFIYERIALNRYKIFGKKESCDLY